MKAATGTYYSLNRERVLAVARQRRIDTRVQPRTRLCPCGNPARSSSHRYCWSCAVAAATRQHVSAAKAGKTAKELGYGASHVAARKRWAVKVAAGEVACWRCGRTIAPGAPWDLGHDEHDRTITRGPEHQLCNRQAGARKGNRIAKQRRRR
jgi:hypothetical protein